jgi:ATP-dependent Clp protease ATP-binding subunit ClpA
MRAGVNILLKHAGLTQGSIDEVIIFKPLSEEQIRQIVDLQMKEVQKRLADRKITVVLTDEAKEWLAKTGFDPTLERVP